ncbi:hypothetical protein PR048_014441 [Dryococelus australis]|uniref:Uncharacterized protein n=1 Tax=Dryococelus australis TaxID=614101 RepID=A0ABQ9HE98_9NEOP|nr:hypothetical protein PR048_014441 [Dryococelus australis]
MHYLYSASLGWMARRTPSLAESNKVSHPEHSSDVSKIPDTQAPFASQRLVTYSPAGAQPIGYLPQYAVSQSDSRPASGVSRGRGGQMVRLLASYLSDPGSLPGVATPEFSHVRIVSDDTFSPPFLHSGAAPSSPRFTLIGSHKFRVKSSPNVSTPLRSLAHPESGYSDIKGIAKGCSWQIVAKILQIQDGAHKDLFMFFLYSLAVLTTPLLSVVDILKYLELTAERPSRNSDMEFYGSAYQFGSHEPAHKGEARRLTRVGALVVVVVAGVVVDVGGVVVVLAVGGLLQHLVVLLAEEAVLAQRELVARDQLALARAAPEALDVVDLRLGAHHEVVLAEAQSTLVALGPEQPAHTCTHLHPLTSPCPFTSCSLYVVHEPMRATEVNTEQRRNEGKGETGDLRENPPSNATVLPGIEPVSLWWEASVLIAHPPWPHDPEFSRVHQARLHNPLCTRVSEEIWTALNIEALRAEEGEMSGAGMKGRGKREIPEKTRRPAVFFDTIPTCENQGVTRPGMNPICRGGRRWSGEIRAALNIEVLRTDEYGASPECMGGETGRPPRKSIDQRHRPAWFPHAKSRKRAAENRVLFSLCEASSLIYTTLTPRK